MGLYGYNLLTNHLLTSWDIQVSGNSIPAGPRQRERKDGYVPKMMVGLGKAMFGVYVRFWGCNTSREQRKKHPTFHEILVG